MALRVATALHAGGCPQVVAVGSIQGLSQIWQAGSPAWLGDIIEDRWAGEGPLGGLLSAMLACPGDVIIAACDLAWLDAANVQILLRAVGSEQTAHSGVRAVFAETKGQMVPVIWWSAQARSILETTFESGERSLRGALRLLSATAVEISEQAARAVTTPHDLWT